MKTKSMLALVTGSSRGIGKAIALQLANDGFDIIIHYNKSTKDAQSVKNEIESLGRECLILKADLTKDDEIELMFDEVGRHYEILDLVVNNAGYDYGYLFEDYTIEQMRYVLDIVLWSKMLVTKLALPFLKKSSNSSIINIASRMGKEKTIKTISVYGPAEAGVIKFTQCCALEFSDYKIRVNCVAPGLTKTDLPNDLFLRETNNQKETDKIWQLMAKNNPSGRVGEPQDIANAVSFLASNKASYINGETIGVNGGSNLG
jgi:3-oxoacyl-[acyl-carrier protein] reductase